MDFSVKAYKFQLYFASVSPLLSSERRTKEKKFHLKYLDLPHEQFGFFHLGLINRKMHKFKMYTESKASWKSCLINKYLNRWLLHMLENINLTNLTDVLSSCSFTKRHWYIEILVLHSNKRWKFHSLYRSNIQFM